MNPADRSQERDPGDAVSATSGETLSPLPGEPGIPNLAAPPRSPIPKKGLLAVGLLVGSLIAVSAVSIQRFASRGKNPEDTSRRIGDKPAAASADPRKLEFPLPASAATAQTPPRIPALQPMDDEPAEPIGVRRSGSGTASTGTSSRSITTLAEDAPVLLVSSRPGALSHAPDRPRSSSERSAGDLPVDSSSGSDDALDTTTRNLQAYQRQLQGVLESLTKAADLAAPAPNGSAPPPPVVLGAAQTISMPTPGSTTPGGSLLGGQLPASVTPKVSATLLGNRSLTLPKGASFTCALKTRLISATSGMVGCQVQRNVYGDDGRVLLIERGSHIDGEYRITSVRPGMVRIPVLWTRVRTPLGVVVDIDSPATGQLGESGIDGHVDNRWSERIGAAMLLSLIDDSVKMVIQSQSNDRQGETIVLPSTTANTSKLAEKVLDSTINIPPLIYQLQGGVVGIYVARDVDFSTVYELVPTELHRNVR